MRVPMKKQKHKSRGKLIVGSGLIMVIMTLIIAACSHSSSEATVQSISPSPAVSMDNTRITADTVVAKVNGEAVVASELSQKISAERSLVYDYFKKKYDVDDNPKFWTSNYGGENPLKFIKKTALDQIIQVKVQQILMKEKGIANDISYTGFIRALDEENKRRKAAEANKEVIYGPLEYGEREYFTYLFNNQVTLLKGEMANKELAATDTNLKQYYESIKEKFFNKGDATTIQIITMKFADDNGKVAETKKQTASSKLNEAKQKLDSGEKFEEVAKLYNLGGVVQRKVYDNTNLFKNKLEIDPAGDVSVKLSVGQVSSVFEADGSYFIVKCVEKHDLGYASFEENKEKLKALYTDMKYTGYVEQLYKQAKVEIAEDIYGAIKAD